MPLKFSRSDAGHEKPAPAPGAHTAAVLQRLLGLGADEVSRLRSDGIV
jgi:crotonobetainyl-CoA:carnitine CoA-transferase CaiB-like acyl-CoA transferase